jgi:hypothetical protein
MATERVEGTCRQCGGVVDAWATHSGVVTAWSGYNDGPATDIEPYPDGVFIGTEYDRMKCRNGCVGEVWGGIRER